MLLHNYQLSSFILRNTEALSTIPLQSTLQNTKALQIITPRKESVSWSKSLHFSQQDHKYYKNDHAFSQIHCSSSATSDSCFSVSELPKRDLWNRFVLVLFIFITSPDKIMHNFRWRTNMYVLKDISDNSLRLSDS